MATLSSCPVCLASYILISFKKENVNLSPKKSRVSSRVAVRQLVFTLEQKALEQKALEQKEVEQKALEQKALEQKALGKKALEQISKLQSKVCFLKMSNHVFQQMRSSFFDRKYNYDEPHVDVEHSFLNLC